MDLVFLKDPDVPFKIRFNGGQFRHRKDLTLGSDTVNFFNTTLSILFMGVKGLISLLVFAIIFTVLNVRNQRFKTSLNGLKQE